TRPVSWSRLVTSTRLPGEPGSSGRTCSASRALSSTTRTRRVASRLRYSPTCASRLAGSCLGGTSNASSRLRTAAAGGAGGPGGGRRDRGAGGVEAAQTQVQLPVGETAAGPVRPVHGQRGLTDPRRPRHHDDARCPGAGAEHAVEVPQLLLAAGETGHVGRQ